MAADQSPRHRLKDCYRKQVPPTGGLWCSSIVCLTQAQCGRELAGDSSLSVEAWVTDPPPSGASSLPQGSVVFIHCVSDAGSVWEGACW